MSHRSQTKLDHKKRYLQVALNGTLEDAQAVISCLPKSERIIIEAGTPLIKRYGEEGIKKIVQWSRERSGFSFFSDLSKLNTQGPFTAFYKMFAQAAHEEAREDAEDMVDVESGGETLEHKVSSSFSYVVADLKTMDRATTEVDMAARAGASAAIALGVAPLETLNSFIEQCAKRGMDSMVDMMNVEYPLVVLKSLKKPPTVVILHRGVDEEQFNKQKQIPLHEIRRIKGSLNCMISVAGGDTVREAQRAIFNDADIVVVWKSVFQKTQDTAELVKEFLQEIK